MHISINQHQKHMKMQGIQDAIMSIFMKSETWFYQFFALESGFDPEMFLEASGM